MNILENYLLVKNKIKHAAEECNRKDSEINLIAVSKSFSEQKIKILLEAGHREFGENRVQEANSKWLELKKSYDKIVLHLIGPLQTNKVRLALEIFDVIESLDRLKLAKEILKHKSRMKKLPDLYVQVNLGEEENKGGCLPINSKSFINECKNMGLNISGVMGIPPLGQDPSPYFALLKKIANEASVQKVSMGMTNDFETAVYMGANYLRIGKGIFGERDG